jgi:hypothetical protein
MAAKKHSVISGAYSGGVSVIAIQSQQWPISATGEESSYAMLSASLQWRSNLK